MNSRFFVSKCKVKVGTHLFLPSWHRTHTEMFYLESRTLSASSTGLFSHGAHVFKSCDIEKIHIKNIEQ